MGRPRIDRGKRNSKLLPKRANYFWECYKENCNELIYAPTKGE